MTNNTEKIPNQRGTSSGEIGENPVEVISKRPAEEENRQPASPKAEEANPKQ